MTCTCRRRPLRRLSEPSCRFPYSPVPRSSCPRSPNINRHRPNRPDFVRHRFCCNCSDKCMTDTARCRTVRHRHKEPNSFPRKKRDNCMTCICRRRNLLRPDTDSCRSDCRLRHRRWLCSLRTSRCEASPTPLMPSLSQSLVYVAGHWQD